MRPAVSVFLSLFFLSGVAVSAAWMLSRADPGEPAPATAPLVPPSGRPEGLLVPLAIWALMNVGFSWSLQPFMPQVQAAQNSGSGWFPAYLRVLATGLFVISSYWTALTLGWVLVEAGVGSEGEARAQFKALCLTCFLALVVPALLMLWFGGWPLLGLAGIVLLAPMAAYAPTVLHVEEDAADVCPRHRPDEVRQVLRGRVGNHP